MYKHRSAFTVDVECGISITMRDSYGMDIKPTERVYINTKKILNLLELKNLKATFFILGIVAEYFPKLVKDISDAGHEVGVHGYHHLEFLKISKDKAFQEISNAKKLIEDLSGKQAYGHRAPAFSINESTKWGLDVVARAGFLYDSSIMPLKSGRYGWQEFQKDIQIVSTENYGELIEVPLCTTKLFGFEIPACGGRYFQILPYSFSKNAFKENLLKRPVIVYMHPYEIDETKYPDYYIKQLQKSSLKNQIKTYIKWFNRHTFYKKIDKLTSEFTFVPLVDLVNEFRHKKTK